MSHLNINPVTGLPMTTDDIGGVDVAGNPYGADLNQPTHHEGNFVPFYDNAWSSHGMCQDTWSGGWNSF